MTVLVSLASAAAIIVAILAIWNTAPMSRQRLWVQRAIHRWRERRALAEHVARFRAEAALNELEARFDELVKAHEAKQVPHDLAMPWAETFRLARESPVGRSFQYGALIVHRDVNAMTVRKEAASITGRDWLDPYRIPPPPQSAVKPSGFPVPVIKDRASPHARVGHRSQQPIWPMCSVKRCRSRRAVLQK